MSNLHVAGESLHVLDSGGGEAAVVFVHGNSLSAVSWEHQLEAPELSRWRRIALDLPGHGQSAPSPEPETRYALPGYGVTLKSLVELFGLSRVVIVGHSMGGHIAMEVARELPQLAGLCVLGAPPLRSPADIARGFVDTPLIRFIGAGELSEAEAAEWARGMFGPNVEPPAWAAESILRVDPKARPSLGESLAQARMADEVAALEAMSPPAGLVHGELDDMVSLDYVRGLDAPMWRGGVHVVDGAGHMPQWERPAVFNALLRDYLEEIGW